VEGIVFDNTTISNKKIIEHFEKLNNQRVIFKIHPRATNFLIGSTCSVKRGKVEIIS
jgi:hypothetical protein